MNPAQYDELVTQSPLGRRAHCFRGTLDPIVIMGLPTAGQHKQRYLEGYVIASDTAMFPVGYVSLAWSSEHFELAEDLQVTVTAATPYPARAGRMTSEQLRAIADELDRRNVPVDQPAPLRRDVWYKLKKNSHEEWTVRLLTLSACGRYARIRRKEETHDRYCNAADLQPTNAACR